MHSGSDRYRRFNPTVGRYSLREITGGRRVSRHRVSTPRLSVRCVQRLVSSLLAVGFFAALGGVVALPPAASRRAVASAAVAGLGIDSFHVLGIDGERAAVVARRAAELRRQISAELLGIDDPTEWTPRCTIHVHLTEESFADAVGGAPVSARGATSIEFVGNDVGMRRIDVMGDLLDGVDSAELDGEGLIPDALGHELVHVILADRFVDGPPPRWADEGLAMLFDSREKQQGHDEDFRDAAIRGLAWSGLDMFEIDLDPADIARERVFYGESLALVRWFLGQGSAATFLCFLEDCDALGLADALDRHYGITSLVEFDGRWQAVLTAAR